MPITLPLNGLCTKTDVLSRMADAGIAVGDTKESIVDEVVLRKIDQAHEEFELVLLSMIQKAVMPFQENHLAQSPSLILAKLYNPTILKQCAVIYTICAMLEEGELRTRFNWGAAADEVAKAAGRWESKKRDALQTAWSLLLFDTDGNGTITTLERMFTNAFTSVRVTV